MKKRLSLLAKSGLNFGLALASWTLLLALADFGRTAIDSMSGSETGSDVTF